MPSVLSRTRLSRVEMSTVASPGAPPTTTVSGAREKLVVLGTGWASVKFAQNIDTRKYDVTLVSPRNYFLFTPFLPSTVVGTIEPRSIVEPIRSLLEYDSRPFTRKIKDVTSGVNKENFKRARFLEAAAVEIDYENNKVKCADISEFVGSGPDSFDVPYDKLVIAVGASSNTFGTPGVKENAMFLKEIEDSLRLRNKLSDLFETAHMEQDPVFKKDMLQICVVGGGPTGVESAVEMDDYIREDLAALYPDEIALTKINLIQSAGDLLNTYEKEVSKYTAEIMVDSTVNVITKTVVTEVSPTSVTIKSRESGEVSEIKTSLVLWSTGVTATPLVKAVMDSVPEQTKRNALETDRNMKVKGLSNVFSMGDCSTVVDAQLMMDSASILYKRGDMNNDGSLDYEEIRVLLESSTKEFPQVELLLSEMARDENHIKTFSEDGSGELNEKQFADFIKSADASVRGLPPTAQVAGQQGTYLASYLNGETEKPFKYFHKGSMAYLGQGKAAAQVSMLASLLPYELQDLPLFGKDIVLTGEFAELIWKILYVDMLISPRNKVQCLFDWFKAYVFGRDTSRF